MTTDDGRPTTVGVSPVSSVNFLRLLQLADSALPVGGAAQSFGIEALVADGILTVNTLESFLRGYLAEAGALEGWYCRAGAKLGHAAAHGQDTAKALASLNAQLSAFKLARESRTASLSMGRRLMSLMRELLSDDIPQTNAHTSSPHPLINSSIPAHYAPTFGYCAGLMGIAAGEAALALLQQSVTGLISVCQRLLPLGQTEAMRLSWRLKATLVQVAEASATEEPPFCCVPLLEMGAMRHAHMNTRMFIS